MHCVAEVEPMPVVLLLAVQGVGPVADAVHTKPIGQTTATDEPAAQYEPDGHDRDTPF